MKAALLLATAVAAQASGLATVDMFRSWLNVHGKGYTGVEFETRFKNFQANLKDIAYFNSIHAGMANGARFGVNHLADRSKEELQARMGFRTPSASLLKSMGPRVLPQAGQVAAASFDWRAVPGVIAPIQDQGQCGSCWAFSAVTNAESMIAIATNKSFVKLSEQQLVDCDHVCGEYRDFNGCDSGCNGGLQPNAFTYMVQNEMQTLDKYPYTATDGTCQSSNRGSGFVTGFNMLSDNEAELATYVSNTGPFAVAVDASAWSFYMGGIMTYLCFGTTTFANLNHAVNVVGYGTDAGVDFWLIRNSWGTTWGEAGYAKILRNQGFCGVQLFANTITLKTPSA